VPPTTTRRERDVSTARKAARRGAAQPASRASRTVRAPAAQGTPGRTRAAPAITSSASQPLRFVDAQALGAWLDRHHDRVPELWVGFWKKGSGKPSIDWPQSVREATGVPSCTGSPAPSAARRRRAGWRS